MESVPTHQHGSLQQERLDTAAEWLLVVGGLLLGTMASGLLHWWPLGLLPVTPRTSQQCFDGYSSIWAFALVAVGSGPGYMKKQGNIVAARDIGHWACSL